MFKYLHKFLNWTISIGFYKHDFCAIHIQGRSPFRYIFKGAFRRVVVSHVMFVKFDKNFQFLNMMYNNSSSLNQPLQQIYSSLCKKSEILAKIKLDKDDNALRKMIHK